MSDKQAIAIAGRALFNEWVGGTDESGDDRRRRRQAREGCSRRPRISGLHPDRPAGE